MMFEALSQQSISQQIQHMPQHTTQTSSATNSDFSIEEVMNVTIESHTQFLRTLKKVKKTFKIDCFVISESGASVSLKKVVTQADQKSEINVIFSALRIQLELSRNKLSDIEFDELIMRTANHRNTLLQF
jgi:hypothetical protein